MWLYKDNKIIGILLVCLKKIFGLIG